MSMIFLRNAIVLSLTLLLTAVVPAAVTADSTDLTFLYAVKEAGRGIPLLKPSAIHVDTLRGEIYLADRGRKEIFVYDEEGKYIQGYGRNDRSLVPFNLSIDSDRNLIVGDQVHPKLSILDFRGKVIDEIGLEFDGSKEFLPGGMSYAPGGIVFVVERYGNSVARVDLGNRRAESWYTHPEKSKAAVELQDVIALPDGTVILLSSKGNAIQVLDKTAKLELSFGEHGSRGNEFSFPSAVAIGPKGNLWIVDTFQHAVKVFDRKGTFIRQFGEMGIEPGKFFFPVDIAFGKGGKVWILERGNARFQVFQME